MTMRRRVLDDNTKREIESEVFQKAMSDMVLVQQQQYEKIGANVAWQNEAIKYNLLDAAELKNLMSRIVPIQSWLSKGKAVWPKELRTGG